MRIHFVRRMWERRPSLRGCVTGDHRIDSEALGGCIVKHQSWRRGDVGEHIGIDCDAVSSLVALDVRAGGSWLRAYEHKMRTRPRNLVLRS